MERLDGWADRVSGTVIFIGAIATVLCVGSVDRASGLYLSLALVYLAPISVVTWRLGRAYGMFVAGLSAIVGFASDAAVAPQTLDVTLVWNACTRLVVFWLVVVALEDLRRSHQGERQMARTDPLTGVSNARHLREEAARHVAGSRRYGYSVSVAYLDLDDFKAINDTFGHSTGDDLLREVGAVLARVVRSTDLVARIGGDEFIVLLPHTDEEAALGAMSRYREAVLAAMDAHGWAVTVSAGIVQLSDEITTVDELISVADASMYQAKRAGKDQILAPSTRIPNDPDVAIASRAAGPFREEAES